MSSRSLPVLIAAFSFGSGVACGGDRDITDIDGAGAIASGPADEPVAPGTEDDGGPPQRFLLTTTLFANDSASSYLVFLDRLEAGAVSLDSAREFPGSVTTVVRDRQVFVADDESPTVTRFDVGEGGELTGQVRISFAAYGLSSVAYGLNFYASSRRAYVSLDASERIVWDPSAMVTLGTFAVGLPEAPVGFDLNASYDRGMTQRDGQVFQSVYLANWDDFTFAPESYIAVWDVATDGVVGVLDTPCPMLDAATIDDAGNIYYSTWLHSIAAELTTGGAPSSCAVRVPPGSASVDAGWTRNLADYTGGRPVVNLQFAGNGIFVASVFHAERTSPPIDTDQVFAANWRLWRFDLDAGSAEPIDSVVWNDGGYSTYRFDGKTYVLVTTQNSESTLAYEIGSDGNAREVFRVAGAGYQLGRL